MGTLPQFQSTDQNSQLMQNAWATQLNPVLSNPLVSGLLLTDNALVAGQDNFISHMLSRAFQGWIVTRIKPTSSTAQPYGSFTNWTAYTPTITGGGTLSNLAVFYRIVGDTLQVRGSTTVGTTTATPFTISLPSGLSIDFTKCPTTQTGQCGFITRIRTAATYASTADGPFILFTDGSTTGSVFLALGGVATNNFNKSNANAGFNAAENIGFQFDVPLLGYSALDGNDYAWEAPLPSNKPNTQFINLHSRNNITVDLYVF